MKNTFGNNLSITICGESHGEALIAVLDGIQPGIKVDMEYISSCLSLRRPQGSISTPRVEKDEFSILSGVFEGKTTGTPISVLIPNTSKKSSDYDELKYLPRPSHADYTASVKYGGNQDYRGGGHFSGRVTAALVAAGAIAQSALKEMGIKIGTHVKRIGAVSDISFCDLEDDIERVSSMPFPVLSSQAGEDMKTEIEKARAECDSVGGQLETAVIGMSAGYGEPYFDSVESMLAHILFSIPAVKGVSFGIGEEFASLRGSQANDTFEMKDGKAVTKTNNNGGINGGITNGMPIIFTCTVKPTPSIAREQSTIDVRSNKNTTLSVHGRHDPCIVHRAAAVVNACTALALLDIIYTRDGNAPKGE